MSQIPMEYKILSLALHAPKEPLFSALREVEPFRDSLRETTEEELVSEYARLFSLTVAGGIPPYETEYGHKDIFSKTQRLADIAGFYRAFGMEIADAERIDFIGAELEFMHWLLRKEAHAREKGEKEKEALCLDAQRKFLKDHLGRWTVFFGKTLAQEARHPFYQSLGKNLSRFVTSECKRLQVEPDAVTEWPVEAVPEELTCGFDGDPPSIRPQPLTVTR